MKKSFWLSLAASVCFVSSAFAGQGLIINISGDPVLWDNSASDPIDIHPEAGSCGQFNNSQMVTKLTNNLDEWASISTLDLDFDIITGTITEDVDGDNYTSYLAGVSGNTSSQSTANVQDNINPILFDDDGEITDAATGVNNGRFSILGFAIPAGFTVDSSNTDLYLDIVDGQAVFNCYCLEDDQGDPQNSDCTTRGASFSEDDLDFTMIHELGHFINLDHSQINADVVGGSDAEEDSLPTMYPASVNAAVQKTVMEDDIVAASSLYPSSSFSNTYCTVTGSLIDRYDEEMRCADLQFNHATDISMSVSFTSGAYAPAEDYNGDSDTQDFDSTEGHECQSDCGDFVFYLRPGETYTFDVANIPGGSNGFEGGSGIGPCVNSQLTECTSTILTACDSDPDSAFCRACVTNETITTNTNGTSIATLLAQCTAGSTVNLGTIQTNSVSQFYVNTLSTSSGGTSTSSSTTLSCSLNTESTSAPSAFVTVGALAMGLLSFVFLKRQKSV
ncbi:MAG: hypothetical protein H7A33_04265 [Deltaproteobacteria bacterium]|nr:hypothetical protein [Deltaproteobacteria bacterium]